MLKVCLIQIYYAMLGALKLFVYRMFRLQQTILFVGDITFLESEPASDNTSESYL